MTPDQRAAQLAADQHSLLCNRDLRRCGLSPKQVRVRVERRGWSRLYRGLVALPGGPRRSWRRDAMAACLLGGPDARAAALTACALHGIWRPPLLPHASVPPTQSARTKGGRFHRWVVPLADRQVVDGIPTVTVGRAIIEAAPMLDQTGLEEVLDQALCARLTTPDAIRASLRRAGPGWTAGPRVEEALRVWTEDIRPGSPAEVRALRRLVDEWGADEVVTQHEIYDDDGIFVGRVDVAIPSRRMAFEYDSDKFHGPRRTPADEARHVRMKRQRWSIDHLSKLDLLPSSTRIRDLLAAAAA